MKHAAVLIREAPHYRHDAFLRGLARCGYRVERGPKDHPEPGDVLVIWNRYAHWEAQALRYEGAGATVLVAENGWIGSDEKGRQLYALCRSNHNGAGTWEVGPEDRWSRLGIDLKPWREDGEHILVLPQRAFGARGVAMPEGWGDDVAARLRAVTDRPVIVRPHPGNVQPKPEPDWKNCWAAVTWASGAGIKAIVAGIPVFHELPRWIGAPAARHGIEGIEAPFLGDRLPMLRRLAWAQWTVDEIADGEPFEWLLADENAGVVADMQTEGYRVLRRAKVTRDNLDFLLD